MLQVGIDKIMPVTEARANIARLVDEVEKGDVFVITRGGKPAAVVVPVDKAEKILGDSSNARNVQNTQNAESVGNARDVNKKPIKYEKNTDLVEKEEPTNDLAVKDEQENLPTINQPTNNLPVEKDESDNNSSVIDMNKVEEELNKINR